MGGNGEGFILETQDIKGLGFDLRISRRLNKLCSTSAKSILTAGESIQRLDIRHQLFTKKSGDKNGELLN